MNARREPEGLILRRMEKNRRRLKILREAPRVKSKSAAKKPLRKRVYRRRSERWIAVGKGKKTVPKRNPQIQRAEFFKDGTS